MKISRKLTLIVLLTLISCHCFCAELPVMKVNDMAQELYCPENTVINNPLALELAVNMGPAQWGYGFVAIETKWSEPLTFELIGSGNYQSYDLFSCAAITLDYGVGSAYTVRHHFGVGVIPASRGAHPPTWGSGGNNNVMHGNLLTANSNTQRVTIDPRKYAPAGWNGKLWIGLIIHNAGVNQYVIARIVNARPSSKAAIPPIFDTVKRLQSGGITFTTDSYKLAAETYQQAAKGMPIELAPYLSLFGEQESKRASEQYQAADDASKAKLRIVLSQFAIDSRNGEAKRKAASELLSRWNNSGGFGKQIGVIVRQASNLVKFGVQDLSTGKLVKARPETIKLTAARREHEGFQLVLTPLVHGAKDVMVSATELKSKNSVIPQANIRIQAVAYTRVFEGKATQLYQPDPLLPEGKRPVLKAGYNQPYWISVKVPENATAGLYKGKVKISSGSHTLSLPISMQVRSFEIPKKISLRSSFWMFRDQINRFYNLDEVKIEDYMKWIDLALEYRLNPIDVYEGRCTQYLDIVKTDPVTNETEVNETPDWSKWDTYMQHMVKGGASTIHLGVSHHQGAYFATKQYPVSSPEQIAKVEKSIEIARKHYIEKGVYDLHYMQLRDETSEPASLNVYRAVYKDMPDVKVLLTAPSEEARGCLRIPTPLTPSYNKQWQDEVVKKGGEYWWYVCVGPSDRRYANLFIDQKAVQHRAWWWQTWTNHVDGLLYWGLNFYKWYHDPILGTMKPRTTPMPDINAIDFSPEENAPGDGFSIYPGATPDKPLPSIRLEIMRDGEEDYEYLIMLEKLVKENPGNKKAISKATKAIANARKLTTSLTSYELDEAVYQKVRNEVADSIEGFRIR